LGTKETGALAALPMFREIILKVYQEKLAGPVPVFPADMEKNIDAYLSGVTGKEQALSLGSSDAMRASDDGTRGCRLAAKILPTNPCEPPPILLQPIYRHRDEHGRLTFTNQ
jgi:hypothetical protein